jgi:hypothetical protein
MGVVFLTNSSTDLDREHYLCSTTLSFRLVDGPVFRIKRPENDIEASVTS